MIFIKGKTMKYLLASIAFLSTSAFGQWAGTENGEIGLTEVAHEEPWSFRVHLAGLPALCGNANKWAYIKKSDPNYDVFVSALLAVKFSKGTATLYTTVDSGGRCYLSHLSID